jgi:hypothetical protein
VAQAVAQRRLLQQESFQWLMEMMAEGLFAFLPLVAQSLALSHLADEIRLALYSGI